MSRDDPHLCNFLFLIWASFSIPDTDHRPLSCPAKAILLHPCRFPPLQCLADPSFSSWAPITWKPITEDILLDSRKSYVRNISKVLDSIWSLDWICISVFGRSMGLFNVETVCGSLRKQAICMMMSMDHSEDDEICFFSLSVSMLLLDFVEASKF